MIFYSLEEFTHIDKCKLGFKEGEIMKIFDLIKQNLVLYTVVVTTLIVQATKAQSQFEDTYYDTTHDSKLSRKISAQIKPTYKPKSNTYYSPIVFVPGDGGSQLEAKLNKTTRVHPICRLVSDWFSIWVNIHLFVPIEIDCLSDNMRLYYDQASRTTYNTPGVKIRPVNFGSLDSVDYLDSYKIAKTDYFERIISTIEKDNGLIRNVDMVGAPFDFRKAPNELEIFFKNLTNLIENTYIRNNYQPVTLICHSMGCLNSLYLLNGKTQKWKDVYIERLITLASPWDGSSKAINALLFGDNLGVPLLPKDKLQKIQSTFPSLMYLFPKKPTFSEDSLLVQTDSFNYTLKDLDRLFRDSDMIDQLNMWLDTKSIAANLRAPNVELWCLYGRGIATPSRIIFEGGLRGKKYKIIEGDGDGTVDLESLRACERFQKSQDKPVFTRQFDNLSHIDILRGTEAADFISNHILTGDYKNY